MLDLFFYFPGFLIDEESLTLVEKICHYNMASFISPIAKNQSSGLPRELMELVLNLGQSRANWNELVTLHVTHSLNSSMV